MTLDTGENLYSIPYTLTTTGDIKLVAHSPEEAYAMARERLTYKHVILTHSWTSPLHDFVLGAETTNAHEIGQPQVISTYDEFSRQTQKKKEEQE